MPITAYCGHYKWEYSERFASCRNCLGSVRLVCETITPITKQVMKAPLEKLPEFLSHTDDVVRKAARLRLQELARWQKVRGI